MNVIRKFLYCISGFYVWLCADDNLKAFPVFDDTWESEKGRDRK